MDIKAGEVITVGIRHLRVLGALDAVTPCRDHRQRIAVRNLATGRLSYLPERQLLKAKQAATEPEKVG